MIKEIKFRPQESELYYNEKLSHAIRFLEDNDQVKLTVVFRGREISHPEIGEKLLLIFVKKMEDYGKAELPPVREPRQVFLIFTPNTAG